MEAAWDHEGARASPGFGLDLLSSEPKQQQQENVGLYRTSPQERSHKPVMQERENQVAIRMESNFLLQRLSH